MSLPPLRSLGLVVIVVAVVAGRPAAGQGLLHKHAHRAVGVPLALPGQQGVSAASTASAAGQTTVVGVDGSVAAAGTGGAAVSSPGGLATVAVPPGTDVTFASPPLDAGGALGDGVVCVMPLPDGQPGHPHVFHPLVPGAIAGSPGTPLAIDGAPLPDAGVVDPRIGDAVSIMPLVDAPLDGAGVSAISAFVRAPAGSSGRHHADHELTMNRVTVAGARGPAVADAARGGGGQMRLGGLPNRAAGMRADAVPGGPGHARGAAGGNASATAPVTGVSKAPATDGSVRQASAATNVARAGQARVPAQAVTAEPRWRDRLRFAWPTTK